MESNEIENRSMQSAKTKCMETQATRDFAYTFQRKYTISLELRDPRRFLSRRKYIVADDLQKRYLTSETVYR